MGFEQSEADLVDGGGVSSGGVPPGVASGVVVSVAGVRDVSDGGVVVVGVEGSAGGEGSGPAVGAELAADLRKVRSLAAECDAAVSVPSARLKGLMGVVESLRRDALDVPEHAGLICEAADLLESSVAAARLRMPPPAVSSKMVRNGPCGCGSGRKAKVCCR